MAFEVEPQPYRYSAFISYSHHDSRVACKLQQRIEDYRLPRRLRKNPGLSTGKLKPVFRDRDELTASPNLTSSIRQALGESECLIVVCTPDAAASPWVALEIEAFRALRHNGAVLPALFSGEPEQAFPSALYASGAGDLESMPLAADFRAEGDGRTLALLKLVAVLAGVGLDALIRRDAQRRLHRTVLGAVAGVLVLGAIVAAAMLTLVARTQARAEQERGVATVARLVDQREAFSRAGRLDLQQANDRAALTFFRGRDVASLPVRAQLLSARLLHGVAEDSEAAGDMVGLRDAALAAGRTTATLLAADPDDAERMLAHGHSEYWAGLAAWRLEQMDEAERRFVAYRRLASALANRAPRNADYQREAGDADSTLATFTMQNVGDLKHGARLFQSAQARFRLAAMAGPYSRDVQSDLADGYAWLADVDRLRGRYPEALTQRLAQRRTLLAMQKRDPDDAAIDLALTRNTLGIARVAALQRRWREAIAEIEAGRAKALILARRDRTNADITRQLRAFDLFEVNTWLDMPIALKPYLSRIMPTLGDCAIEKVKLNNEEAANFCTILAARLAVTQGDYGLAEKLLANVITSKHQMFSPRWRLYIPGEVSRIKNDIDRRRTK